MIMCIHPQATLQRSKAAYPRAVSKEVDCQVQITLRCSGLCVQKKDGPLCLHSLQSAEQQTDTPPQDSGSY